MLDQLTIGEKLYLLDYNVSASELIWKTLFELHLKEVIKIDVHGIQLQSSTEKFRKYESLLLLPLVKEEGQFLYFDDYKMKLGRILYRFYRYKEILFDNSWRLTTLLEDRNFFVTLLFGKRYSDKGVVERSKLKKHIKKLSTGLAHFSELNEEEIQFLKSHKIDLTLLNPRDIKKDKDILLNLFNNLEVDLLINQLTDYRDKYDYIDSGGGDFVDFCDGSDGDGDGGGGDGDGGGDGGD
ncbi:hypothetical protein MY04_4354 [Flammeovirga sp. MY04]|uniref:hypothetical protein n=1 Tax=Flammeovirga sp. MY04 TaxID=1191459 RepID=UPI00080617BA|nr:hypothetical protein [Flammeovirga sp. MY04]ANQ51692.1 hypothetical protein MY04_4354 [Flammeovirga sp. MY04]